MTAKLSAALAEGRGIITLNEKGNSMSKFFQTIAGLSATICCIGVACVFAASAVAAKTQQAPAKQGVVMQQRLSDGIY
ncbi:hypothetical protein VU06_03580, partial [Desulfobulbus sp. F3]|nr:hypothetical protein [Desulfobulbus sp. F3]